MRYNDIRRKTRSVAVGQCRIGARAPIAIQSMTNTPTEDAMRTLEQVRALERAGCDIVRLSVPTEEAAYTVWKLKEAGVKMPIVADIHFDYRIALRCAELGFDKIRIGGNIAFHRRMRLWPWRKRQQSLQHFSNTKIIYSTSKKHRCQTSG